MAGKEKRREESLAWSKHSVCMLQPADSGWRPRLMIVVCLGARFWCVCVWPGHRARMWSWMVDGVGEMLACACLSTANWIPNAHQNPHTQTATFCREQGERNVRIVVCLYAQQPAEPSSSRSSPSNVFIIQLLDVIQHCVTITILTTILVIRQQWTPWRKRLSRTPFPFFSTWNNNGNKTIITVVIIMNYWTVPVLLFQSLVWVCVFAYTIIVTNDKPNLEPWYTQTRILINSGCVFCWFLEFCHSFNSNHRIIMNAKDSIESMMMEWQQQL